MKQFDWDETKNAWLIAKRDISFEEIVVALQTGALLDDVVHPNVARFGHQRVLIVRIGDQAWAVPYVEYEDRLFLKTGFPSRRLTRRYLRGTV